MQLEEHYIVTITDNMVKVEHSESEAQSISLTDVNKIMLINTNQGPFLPDVWLTLTGIDSWCKIPQGCQGFEEVFDLVSKYDDFIFENVIKSMSCTDNAEFLLWERP